MEDDRQDLQERTYALAKENNKLLKKLRRGTWISLIFKLLFWAVMLGLPIWFYFTFLQPIVQQGIGVLDQVQSVTGQAGAQTEQIKGLIDAIPGINLLR